jgi:hypothetical protein
MRKSQRRICARARGDHGEMIARASACIERESPRGGCT